MSPDFMDQVNYSTTFGENMIVFYDPWDGEIQQTGSRRGYSAEIMFRASDEHCCARGRW